VKDRKGLWLGDGIPLAAGMKANPIRWPLHPKAGVNQPESTSSAGSKDEGQQCRDMQNQICPVTCSATELGLGTADGAWSRTWVLPQTKTLTDI